MESVSTRLNDETARLIRETAEERGVSQAEVLRDLVEKGIRYDDRVEELEQDHERTREQYKEQIDHLEQQIDRLEREKRLILEQREENTELVRTFERQQSLQERKARAGLWTKTKWALFGMDDDE